MIKKRGESMQPENPKLYLENLIQQNDKEGKRPRLLLHSCCAPCSSYVLEYLMTHFEITVFYYNPNIYPPEEFQMRAEEQKRFTELFSEGKIKVVTMPYEDSLFYAAVKGLEQECEGGARCEACFKLRFEKTAKYAKEYEFDYFTTTLSISPHKNSATLNRIGDEVAQEYGVPYLYSDFKKNGGYLRSCQISKEFEIYRQDYCGCVFSKRESEERKVKKDI